ncbi:ArsR/SmtB family transcription factor [Actinosynnema sp. NPDC053489]|uniref:ArsR/SmtB family transcription factor n=1 Tax=Actinosynnema sp. NPDC053489 TaxID=3363916 RepID=UPI0037C802BD
MPEEFRNLRALAHPLGLRILSLLAGSAMSAAEVAREIGGTQANVSYHLRTLREAGLVEVVDEVRVRGGMAKRYRHEPSSGERFAERDVEQERVCAAALGEELRRRGEHRRNGPPSTTTDAELWVEEQVRDAAVAKARELGVLRHGAARAPRTPGTIGVSATVSLFAMADR